MAVVLALDLGSSFLKAQRFDDDGSPVGAPGRQPAQIGPDGTADAEQVADHVDALLDEALAGGPAPTAVAISAAWHTLVGVDDEGRATTELSTWLDSRASREAARLRAAVGDPEDVHDRVGAPIHPSFPSARILWTARHRPDAFNATARWCSLSEFLLSRWFGAPVGPSSSIASASGLYDQRVGAWDAEVLAAVGLDAERLAPVDDEPRTGLASAYRPRWPAVADLPWFPAMGDGACAVLGVGVHPGRAALTVGTSAAVRVVADRRRRFAAPLPAALFGYLADAASSVVGAARSNAGAAVEWAADVLGVEGDDPVHDATAGRPPGGHGLRVDPSLITERSPYWPLAPSAHIDGLRRTTTRLDVLQAFVEAVALGVAAAVAAFEAWAGPHSLVLGGGASSSPGWRHLVADVIGKPIACSAVSDESARGAALAALERLGSSMPAPPSDEATVEPDEKRAAAFAELRAALTEPPFAASLGP